AALLSNHPAMKAPITAVRPLITSDATPSTYDVVMTSMGCVRRCTFCDAANLRYEQIEPSLIAEDILGRSRRHLDIGDAILLPRQARLDVVKQAIDAYAHDALSFSSELSLDLTSESHLQTLIDFGVIEV